MDVNENHVQTLLSMGFPNDSEIRRALRMSKNDLNDAVAVLTNDHVTTNYDTLEEYNVEMKDFQSPVNIPLTVYGPTPPPAYEESIETDVGIAWVVSMQGVNLKICVGKQTGRPAFWEELLRSMYFLQNIYLPS